jgi:hypothetical protein
MKLNAKGSKPTNNSVSLTASGASQPTNFLSLNAVGSSPTTSSITLSADGQMPENRMVDLGGGASQPETWNPVTVVRRGVQKLFANFIPPVFNSNNAGNYQPPPKAPIFAVIPKGVCKGCK